MVGFLGLPDSYSIWMLDIEFARLREPNTWYLTDANCSISQHIFSVLFTAVGSKDERDMSQIQRWENFQKNLKILKSVHFAFL